jgi:hypothetical protein
MFTRYVYVCVNQDTVAPVTELLIGLKSRDRPCAGCRQEIEFDSDEDVLGSLAYFQVTPLPHSLHAFPLLHSSRALAVTAFFLVLIFLQALTVS